MLNTSQCICKILNYTFQVTIEYTHLGIARHSAISIPIHWYIISYTNIAHGYIYIGTGGEGGSLACKSQVAQKLLKI